MIDHVDRWMGEEQQADQTDQPGKPRSIPNSNPDEAHKIKKRGRVNRKKTHSYAFQKFVKFLTFLALVT